MSVIRNLTSAFSSQKLWPMDFCTYIDVSDNTMWKSTEKGISFGSKFSLFNRIVVMRPSAAYRFLKNIAKFESKWRKKRSSE